MEAYHKASMAMAAAGLPRVELLFAALPGPVRDTLDRFGFDKATDPATTRFLSVTAAIASLYERDDEEEDWDEITRDVSAFGDVLALALDAAAGGGYGAGGGGGVPGARASRADAAAGGKALSGGSREGSIADAGVVAVHGQSSAGGSSGQHSGAGKAGASGSGSGDGGQRGRDDDAEEDFDKTM
jgi:hypothetical protein